MMPDGVLSILEISAVQDSDFATYNCSAANTDDSTYLPIKFSKKGTYKFQFRRIRALCALLRSSDEDHRSQYIIMKIIITKSTKQLFLHS